MNTTYMLHGTVSQCTMNTDTEPTIYYIIYLLRATVLSTVCPGGLAEHYESWYFVVLPCICRVFVFVLA
jgi:hypothetical protein